MRPTGWMYVVRDWAKWPCLIAHCAFVYMVGRRYTPGQEWIWAVLALVYPPFTTALVYVYLRQQGSAQAAASQPV